MDLTPCLGCFAGDIVGHPALAKAERLGASIK